MPVRIQKPAVNIREKLAELERPIGVNGAALMATNTPQEAFSLIGAGRKNILINGNFQVSQRGDYTSSPVNAGHDTYWLDRWTSLKDGTTSTIQRVTRTINGVTKYAARIECTVGGTGIFGFGQRIELQNIPVGEILTISCWVRTNHPFVGFRTNLFRGYGGDMGEKFPSDGGWRKVSHTFNSTGTTGSGQGYADILIVAYNNANVNISAGQYIEIADVQLEVGKVATPFEYRSYGQELALCQRYYYRKNMTQSGDRYCAAFAYLSTTAEGIIQFPVSMRTRPTSVETTGTASNYSLINATGTGINCTSVPIYYTSNTEGMTLSCSVASGLVAGNATLLYSSVANTYLGFSAEL